MNPSLHSFLPPAAPDQGISSVTPSLAAVDPSGTPSNVSVPATAEEAADPSLAKEREKLENFLTSLDDYIPTIPDEVVSYYLTRTGFQTTDKRTIRLVSLATQRFLSNLAEDSFHHYQLRTQTNRDRSRPNPRDRRVTLTMEDLSSSLRNAGINLRKPAYHADRLTSGVESAPASNKRQRAAKD